LDPLSAATAEELAALDAFLGRMKHDLGKYVSLQMRWLAEEASLEDRERALKADLLATRRGPQGTQDALSVYREFRPVLMGDEPLSAGIVMNLSAHPMVVSLDAAMEEVARIAHVLTDSAVGEDDIDRGGRAALTVSNHCRDLYRLVRKLRGA
jgi:hypothetical protein